jgi:hypothetical protein
MTRISALNTTPTPTPTHRKISTNYVQWYLSRVSNPNKKFISWIEKVEKKISTLLQVTLLDLPDEDYTIYFEEEYSPEEMCKIIFESNGLNCVK